MQAVPGAHPQLLPVWHRVLGVPLRATVFVVVHARLVLLVHTPAAVAVNQDLGDVIFGAETSQVCSPGGLIVHDVHVGRNTRACSIFAVLPRALDATNGCGFLVGHTQLLQFFKLLTEPARGAHLQIVWLGQPPGSDDGAVLCEVDVPVDIAVAVGRPVPLHVRTALLSC